MEYIIKPEYKVWVAVKPEIRESFCSQILNSDILISDLDNTEGPSPAKKIAEDALKDPSYFLSINFLKWFFESGIKWVKEGKKSESESWKKFIELFLKDKNNLKKVKEKITPFYASVTSYKGLKEFYGLLNATKLYLTRNIKEITEAYEKAFDFEDSFVEQFEKEKTIKQILSQYPNKKRLIIKSDLDEVEVNEAVFDYLKFKTRKKSLEYFISIVVSKFPDNKDNSFHIKISRDYTGLVNLLKKHIYQK
jgi:hypothetical protein